MVARKNNKLGKFDSRKKTAEINSLGREEKRWKEKRLKLNSLSYPHLYHFTAQLYLCLDISYINFFIEVKFT